MSTINILVILVVLYYDAVMGVIIIKILVYFYDYDRDHDGDDKVW